MKEVKVFLGTIERVKDFVNEVSRLDCDVDIVSGRYVIDAKSIMGIFSTDLSKPVNVSLIKETLASILGGYFRVLVKII